MMVSPLIQFAQAQVDCNQDIPCTTGLPKVLGSTNELQTILQMTFAILGGVALIIVLVAGMRFVVSNGDSETINKTRNTIIYAAIGLAISLSAEIIVTFVLNNV